ncbi:MAG: lysylphosphatidylglycerol synthase domain-containing protein, partial [Candidatus Hodarchaeota archaeon]
MTKSQTSTYHKSKLGSRVHSRLAVGVVFALFIISGIMLIYLLRDVDLTQFWKVGPFYLVLILLLSLLSIGFYSLAVYTLIQASGYKTTFVQTYLVLTASLGANYVTPVRVGIPLRIYLYKHLMDVPMSTGTALITVEVIVGMLTPAFI